MKQNHTAFHEQVNQTWGYIAPAGTLPKLTDFGYVPSSSIYVWITTTFHAAVETFDGAFEDWENLATRTALKQTALEDAEAILKPLYRQLYGLFKGNLEVKDTDLQAMGMPKRPAGGHHSVTPAPASKPEAVTELPGEGVVIIHFRDEGSDKKAKPPGVHGAEIGWEVLDTPPVDWSELRHSSFDTHSPFKLTFTGQERGHHLYFALRWENTTGVKGDWSGIYDVIIP